MITFIAFILTLAGCVNWLLIGLLQYDFIAGLFGYQASIFSRLIYILFGVAAAYLVLRVIVNKGTFKVFERKKKKQKAELSSSTPANAQPAVVNVEAGQEQIPQKTKKKKWWQFWKRNPKTQKKKTEVNLVEKVESTQFNNPNMQTSMPSQAQSQPSNFFDAPTKAEPIPQDNLFDEHLGK